MYDDDVRLLIVLKTKFGNFGNIVINNFLNAY